MSVKRKAAIAQALKCCGKEDTDCDNCPYLGGPCDQPFLEFVRLPVFLLEDIKTELFEPAAPWPWEDDMNNGSVS